MAKISVIVPVYKVEPYLNRCIDSILNQTYTDLEVILVDDGSPDNCPALCDQAAQRDPRVKVIHKENGGVSSARNAGLDAATGDYVAFVDGDDTVDLRFVEYLLKACEKAGADVAFCNFRRISEASQADQTVCEFDSLDLEEGAGSDCVDQFFARWCQPNVFNKLIKRDLLGELRFPDAVKAEDLWFSYRVLERAQRVAGMKHCSLYYYWQNEGSAMRQVACKHAEDELRLRLDIYTTLLKGRYPVCRQFSDQTMRNYLDYCLCARGGFRALSDVLTDYGRVLAAEMWMPEAKSVKEKIDLYTLLISHRLWTMKRLVSYKLFGTPLYLD